MKRRCGMKKQAIHDRGLITGDFPLTLFPTRGNLAVPEQSFLHREKRRMPIHTRRAYPRTYRKSPIRFKASGATHYRKAILCNESAGGLCFETDTPLFPGTVIHVIMDDHGQAKTAPEPGEWDAEVRWCRRVGRYPKRFSIGARFYKKIVV